METIDTRPLRFLAASAESEAGAERWDCTYEHCRRLRKTPFKHLKDAVNHVYEHSDGEEKAPTQFLASWCELCRYNVAREGKALRVHYRSVHKLQENARAKFCTACKVTWHTKLSEHQENFCARAGASEKPELYGRRWDEQLLKYDYSACPEVEIVCNPKPPQEVLEAANNGRKEEYALHQAAAERKARILSQPREELEKSVKERVKNLKERHRYYDNVGTPELIDHEEIDDIKRELRDFKRWTSQPGSSASLSKTRVRLTARQRVVYE